MESAPMLACRRIAQLSLLTALANGILAGCHHGQYPNPYLQPAAGNPWSTPNAAAFPPATSLPPPASQATPPLFPGTPSPMPSVPAAPAVPPAVGSTPAAPVGSGIQGPNWNNPGTIAQQQERAIVFDPFANNEIGPEVVGGRPRDFQRPMTEAARAQPFRLGGGPF
jgi:hypothetical protein